MSSFFFLVIKVFLEFFGDKLSSPSAVSSSCAHILYTHFDTMIGEQTNKTHGYAYNRVGLSSRGGGGITGSYGTVLCPRGAYNRGSLLTWGGGGLLIRILRCSPYPKT